MRSYLWIFPSVKMALIINAIWLGLVACQTTEGVLIHETPLGISETRRAIVIVIGEPLVISENGRDLYSKYYDRRGKYFEKTEKPKERMQTLVTILGDRRPYDIDVNVRREAKTGEGRYEFVSHDPVAAKRVATELKKVLNQSRDNRNVIDDFKPY